MHCISDARMRSKLGYKQASLLSYHGVCDRRNRCLICIECCVCDCVLSSLSLPSLSHGVCNRRSRCAFCIECGCCTRISFSVMCSVPHALSLCRLPYPLSALLLSSCSRPLCRCYPRPLPHCSGARIRDASVPACAPYVPPLSHPSVCTCVYACECDCVCVCVCPCAHICMCVCVCPRVLYVIACVLMYV